MTDQYERVEAQVEAEIVKWLDGLFVRLSAALEKRNEIEARKVEIEAQKVAIMADFMSSDLREAIAAIQMRIADVVERGIGEKVV